MRPCVPTPTSVCLLPAGWMPLKGLQSPAGREEDSEEEGLKWKGGLRETEERAQSRPKHKHSRAAQRPPKEVPRKGDRLLSNRLFHSLCVCVCACVRARTCRSQRTTCRSLFPLHHVGLEIQVKSLPLPLHFMCVCVWGGGVSIVCQVGQGCFAREPQESTCLHLLGSAVRSLFFKVQSSEPRWSCWNGRGLTH